MHERSPIALLHSCVSDRVAGMADKLEFYGDGPSIKPEDNWQAQEALGGADLARVLHSIDPYNITNEDDLTLVGIAWEFVWGETPPEIILEKRQDMIEKFQNGQELTKLEEVWYNLALVDTDIF